MHRGLAFDLMAQTWSFLCCLDRKSPHSINTIARTVPQGCEVWHSVKCSLYMLDAPSWVGWIKKLNWKDDTLWNMYCYSTQCTYTFKQQQQKQTNLMMQSLGLLKPQLAFPCTYFVFLAPSASSSGAKRDIIETIRSPLKKIMWTFKKFKRWFTELDLEMNDMVHKHHGFTMVLLCIPMYGGFSVLWCV